MIEQLLRGPMAGQFKKAFEKLTPEQLGPMLAGFGIENFSFRELTGEALESSPLPKPSGSRQFAVSGVFKGQRLLSLILLEQDTTRLEEGSSNALANGK